MAVIVYLLKIQVRDLLLWQDVYMGEAGGAGGASQVIKDVISSQNGSQDGSDGANELAEEIDKLQVGDDYYYYLIILFYTLSEWVKGVNSRRVSRI